ncbi:oxidoreductase, zinc-binding dehydrogenase family protein [Leptospira ryugenii]|uniref:Oxidoreductase, zinc-binding dehydrogenase family protein n=1 Tax=Leptospira ryugenii TaxID=1917863 RepID=A0A2P2E3X9_9LEPT|nr:medium chain dehydrogenase/reductase family protein [Leptospira ryugenii]GBF51588.1 oxidoreductase, zinc-binding dehydrogenase family protein [Leptospira ryugenii]
MQREVYRVIQPGSLSGLKRRSESFEQPKDNEISVRIRAIGLNFADVFSVYGMYSATPKEPFIPGLEFAGTVIEVGNDCKTFRKGDEIFGTTRFGAYATHINIDERYVFPLPKDWSHRAGAAYPVQALTAYYALHVLGDLQSKQTILVHSAAGGVGLYANQIAKKQNAYTIALIGSEAKIKTIQDAGYDDFIIRGPNFRKDLEEKLNGKRLDLVLECTGGRYFSDSFDLLSPMGRLITYGSANFTPRSSSRNWIHLAFQYLNRPKIDPLAMISANKSVMGFNLIWLWNEIDVLQKHFNALNALKLYQQVIGDTFSFENLPEALKKFKNGNTIGKIIIDVS